MTKWLTGVVVLFFLVWLGLGFISWNLDVSSWTGEERGTMIVTWLVFVAALSVAIIPVEKD
jgi:hypothetical protein